MASPGLLCLRDAELKKPVSIVWFRQDLRLSDNPALRAAVERGGQVIPVYVWAPDEEGAWPLGEASKWWLHQSLNSLSHALRTAGARLVLRKGSSLSELLEVAREAKATAVFWNRRHEPWVARRDEKIQDELRESGFEVETFNGSLLHEPSAIQNKSGNPFQVFTPFWKACLSTHEPAAPLPAPRRLSTPEKMPPSAALKNLRLEPKLNWADGFYGEWHPGERGAARTLRNFLESAFDGYAQNRDRPDLRGTSRLSPHLHFGEISPRQVWHAVKAHAGSCRIPMTQWRSGRFLVELGWREFAHHLLHHFPNTPERPLRPEFSRFPWRNNPAWLEAWQRGRTGYPVVDAGMRELWTTGWMHNRVRMVVGSFLVKNLLLPWQEGARWFWDTLVDADIANNTLGWQWIAGCGADAAPYFRIFNPVNQGEKFDPDGAYVRKWVPELAKVPDGFVHRPWELSPAELAHCGLGSSIYAKPVVSLFISRQVALEAYQTLKLNWNRHE